MVKPRQSRTEDWMDLKFRLHDGTDIGPIHYSAAATIAMLKERIISEWPRDKKMVVPNSADELKLISAGKVLEDGKKVSQCRVRFGESPGGVTTMHVVIQTKAKTRKKITLPRCACSVM